MRKRRPTGRKIKPTWRKIKHTRRKIKHTGIKIKPIGRKLRPTTGRKIRPTKRNIGTPAGLEEPASLVLKMVTVVFKLPVFYYCNYIESVDYLACVLLTLLTLLNTLPVLY